MPHDSDPQAEATIEPETTMDPSADDAGGPEVAAPVESAPADAGQSWAPPSREEYERIRQQAEIGAEFAPHAEQIRGLMRQGFTPKQAEKEVAKQEQAVAARHRLHDPAKFQEFWATASKNPDALLDLIDERAREIAKPYEDRFKKYDERFGSLEKRANELHGHAVYSNYEKRPEFGKVHKDFNELLGKGKDPETAWEIATLRMQVAASKAAPAAPAGAAPQRAAKAPIKPAPREDRSAPKPGASRGVTATSPVTSTPAVGSKGMAAFRNAAKRVAQAS